MGTILASEVIAKAHELAEDEAAETWTESQAIRWLNEGQLAVCVLKPNAKTITRSILLSPGTTKQAIEGRQLLSIIRNMGVDGTTPGRAIRLVDRGMKDESDPNWHSATPGSVIKEYVFDDRDEQAFYVSPPAHAANAMYIEAMEALNPVDVAADDPIDIEDIYAPALVEWIAYRFFGRDSEETPNFVRAKGYLQNFYNLLQVKAKVDAGYTPKTRKQNE